MIAARQIFLGRGGAKLPYDAEVEYLESTGTQWIDTGIYGDLDTVAELRAAATAADALYPLFGARNGYASKAFDLYNGSDVGYYYTVNFDSAFPGYDYSKSDVPATIGSWVDFRIGKTMQIGEWTKDWSHYASAFTTSHTLDIFAWNQNGTITTGKYKVSSCKIYKSGVLVRDMTPVRFTNELGQSEGAMYDRVSGQLFRNQGTGEFLYGRDINPISARSYVNDGLVAMWDGIENAGWGVHDANATVWKDLVGIADITLSRTTVGDDYIFFPKGSNNGYGTADFPTSYGAIEIVLSKSINYNNSAYECCIISIGSVYSGLGICAPKGDVTDTYDAGEAPYITIQDGELFSVSLNKSGVATTEIAKNGVIGSVGIKAKGSRYSTGSQCLNGGASGGQRSSEMYIKSIRIYSRALTAEEIAANYAVDKERFNLP